MSKLSKPIIRTDPDEELQIVLSMLYYQPTGYRSNARKLYNAIRDKGYNFPCKKVREWLHNQNEWQKYAPSPKNTPRKNSKTKLCTTSYFLRMINIRGRHGKQYYRL